MSRHACFRIVGCSRSARPFRIHSEAACARRTTLHDYDYQAVPWTNSVQIFAVLL